MTNMLKAYILMWSY